MNAVTEQLLRVVAVEAFQKRKFLVGAFVAINAIAMAAGLNWPEIYTASTSIVVQERNIIQPLMQGAAVATEVANRARIAREVVYSRRVMNQVIDSLGMADETTSTAERDRIVEGVKDRTTVLTVGNQGLINLTYKDKDPDRAFAVTAKLAEVFISESFGTKAAESTSAFEFIDKQVKEYHDKLMQVEESLKDYRESNVDARPGSEIEVSARLAQFKQTIEQTERELRETEVRKNSLERQLAGEAETTSALTREGQYRSRISELQAQLETLRLSYHDTYPDIVRLRNQINDLKEAVAAEQVRREAARGSGQSVVDESLLVHNPVYQQLRQQLLQTRTQIDTLNARIYEARRQLKDEMERGRRVAGSESELAQLTRDYQVNRDIYQDLLRRRETARVSMNLDLERQGLTFRVHEPPLRPGKPGGPQLVHLVLGGFILSIGLPIGALIMLVKLDPRIRFSSLLEDRLKIPVLGSVPRLWVPAEVSSTRVQIVGLSYVVMSTVLVIALFMFLRLVKVV